MRRVIRIQNFPGRAMKIFLLLWPVWMVSGSSQLQKFVPGNQNFSTDIYKQLTKIETGNFMVSPLSLEIALALVAAGARGITGGEIRSTLYLPTRQSEVNSIFSEVVQTLRSTGNYSLATANRLFIKEGFHIQNNYINLASRYYNAGAENVDFTKAQESSDLINGWVERQTNNKIKDLIPVASITPDLVFILVNTLYLRANWSEQFLSIENPVTFYGINNQTVAVQMMERTSTYNYYDSKELDSQIIEIPYIDNDISMIIALPKQRDGLADLERHITELLAHNKFSRERVHVRLPKFTTESNFNLIPILKNLGIRTVFSVESNLDGIAPNLYVNKVLQKTFIKVTEIGTEAAAATGVLVATTAVEYPPPIGFNADHSFVYYIRNKENVTLFIGRYAIGEK